MFLACGGSEDPTGTPDAADRAADADPDAGGGGRATDFVADRAGWIQLIEGHASYDGWGASLMDAILLPPAELVAAAGECEVWARPDEPAECDPPCQDSYCASDDQCLPFPNPASAGPIEVSGLTVALRFEADAYGYYVPDPLVPPDEVFATGATITATADGDELPGFELTVTGLAPLEADLDGGAFVIEDGVDREVRWTPADSGRIQLALQVGHHGAPFLAMLVCESDDDGALVIPGSVIERLPRDDSGFEQHFSWIARFDRAVHEASAGPIELFVANRVIISSIDHR